MINIWNPDLAVIPRPTKPVWKTYKHLANHVFIHIPKSGGTTFKRMFPMIDRGRTKKKHHFYRDPKKDYKYITVMRDPFQRTWSHWNWNLHHKFLQPLNQYHPSVNPQIPYETTYSHFPGLEGSVSNVAARMMTGILRPSIEQALEAYDKFFTFLILKIFNKVSIRFLTCVESNQKS